MKERKGILFILFPVILTLGMYLVFYDRIACKPSHAGFWLILVLGVSIGVALTRFFQWSKSKKPDKN